MQHLDVYYYFYQILRNRAETDSFERKRKRIGDGSVGMFSSLLVAALSGQFSFLLDISFSCLLFVAWCVKVLLTNPIWVAKVVVEPRSGFIPRMYIRENTRILSDIRTVVQTHTRKDKDSHTKLVASQDEISAVVEPPPYGTSHTIQEVYGEAGISGFWNGVFPTLFMVSNPSIQFMLYETLLKKIRKRRASSKKGANDVTALEIFLLGAVAKTWSYSCNVSSSGYQGTLDAMMKIIHYEGFHGFYKGLGTKIVQSVLAAAVSIHGQGGTC
ncbi:hypothetical protein RND71_026018 [Anisodus tanguticus]|uniref:Uncharacterized protein n=1 Tax=Anisodus tanguticus TaxID=243964 RepID=A0AAE1RMH2_9SOLA|nr:hypothetical protein RND71_026018 [Anisodus tanguticus]